VTPLERAEEVVRRCRELARCSEEPHATTRTFLSAPMRDVHALVTQWMHSAGMTVRVDAAGNLRGVYRSGRPTQARRLVIGSHLDTVPNAGAFDGILGVMLAVALVEQLEGRSYPYAIEAVGFSEEEGVRFNAPFIGSRAFIGSLDAALLDLTMSGGMDGIEAAAQIAARPQPPIVVLVSTYSGQEYADQIEHSGARAYLEKSEFGPERLLEVWATVSAGSTASTENSPSVGQTSTDGPPAGRPAGGSIGDT